MRPDDTQEIRASFTFYPSDLTALRRLTLALRDAGLDVSRADTLRALLHAAPEADLVRAATLRLAAEAAGQLPADERVAERLSVVVQRGHLRKLDHAIDSLARRDLDADRSFLVRSALHADHDPKVLVRTAKKLLAAFPDRRTRAGRSA